MKASILIFGLLLANFAQAGDIVCNINSRFERNWSGNYSQKNVNINYRIKFNYGRLSVTNNAVMYPFRTATVFERFERQVVSNGVVLKTHETNSQSNSTLDIHTMSNQTLDQITKGMRVPTIISHSAWNPEEGFEVELFSDTGVCFLE